MAEPEAREAGNTAPAGFAILTKIISRLGGEYVVRRHS